ncbi:MAG TPA: SPW repeat protein [Nitrospira sp.]|nr:SPW repeat protein [Nitrospira sp.]
MTMKYLPWILALIAIWLIAAPFVLDYAQTEQAMRNDVAVGFVMLLGALFWGLSEWRHHDWGTDMQTQRR